MKKRQLLFGAKVQNTELEQKKNVEAMKSLNIFQGIQKLPLFRFIECLSDNNLHALVIPGSAGNPTDEELQEAWGKILSEYSDSIGTAEYKMYVNCYKEISIYKITLDQIQIAVDLLRVNNSKYFQDQLNKLLHTKCTFNYLDQATYQAELSKCERMAKGIKIRLDLKVNQFQAMKDSFEKEIPGEIPDKRAVFASTLVTLSDHAKYHISDAIMTGEYCERIKRFNKYVDSLNSKPKK